MKTSKKRKIRINRPKVCEGGCCFCKDATALRWEGYKDLEKFLTVRGRLMARKQSGLCSKHQGRVAKVVKEARELGLLPYTAQVDFS